jgi:hypothetical protein
MCGHRNNDGVRPLSAISRQVPRIAPPIRFQRCEQPGQQQGLRFPSLRLEQPHLIRRLLVSGFLAESIQQIHSFRASGVTFSHASNALASEASAFFRSAGRSWTTPPEISFSLKARAQAYRPLHVLASVKGRPMPRSNFLDQRPLSPDIMSALGQKRAWRILSK